MKLLKMKRATTTTKIVYLKLQQCSRPAGGRMQCMGEVIITICSCLVVSLARRNRLTQLHVQLRVTPGWFYARARTQWLRFSCTCQAQLSRTWSPNMPLPSQTSARLIVIKFVCLFIRKKVSRQMYKGDKIMVLCLRLCSFAKQCGGEIAYISNNSNTDNVYPPFALTHSPCFVSFQIRKTPWA